jgi:hypothetical protein
MTQKHLFKQAFREKLTQIPRNALPLLSLRRYYAARTHRHNSLYFIKLHFYQKNLGEERGVGTRLDK